MRAMETSDKTIDAQSVCQACGACCAYSQNWPRFTTEDDAALDLIPPKFVNDRLSGMRCDGDRCSALSGKIGVATSCGIYAHRPEVCRTCMPGDAECQMARRRHGLPALTWFYESSPRRRVILISTSSRRTPGPIPRDLSISRFGRRLLKQLNSV